jgi:hypothetical protein
MNCKHHNPNRQTNNELICTGCSPERACERCVNNVKPPMESSRSSKPDGELFTAFSFEISSCEEVCVLKNLKIRAKTKKATRLDDLVISRKIRAQAGGLDFAVFFIFAAAFLRLM